MPRDKRAIKEKGDSLIQMTASFCEARLDEEYKELCERLIRKMSRKRSVPFLRGKLEIWAAAVVYAVGKVNFLFDKSFEPHASADEICKHFGANKSSVSQKAKTIRDMFKMDYWNPEFSTSKMLEGNPLNDFMMVDDLIVHKGGLSELFKEAARFAGAGEALRAAPEERAALPASAAEWLADVANAYREARSARPVAEKLLGMRIGEEDLFHLAPHVFFKWRGGDLPAAKRDEVVKMTLRNYLATLEHAEGGEDLERSPILSFAFCWLVAHMMADLLDEDSTHLLVELCAAKEDDLAEMAGARRRGNEVGEAEEDQLPEEPPSERRRRSKKVEAQFARIKVIVGDEEGRDRHESVAIYREHLKDNLRLPCEVAGSEDFRWEERYVFGVGDGDEYEELKRTRPSYKDRYELLEITDGRESDWKLFWEDTVARVRRVSDGREFLLGLAELETTDEESENYQLLDDYTVWFVNSR